MVRGPAALLALVGAALAYVLVAPELPQLHPPELSALVASAVGLTFVVAIVAPKIVVVMGEDALSTLNDLDVPLARTLEPELGAVQPFTPACDGLVVPNIDEALDEEAAKREFWSAFRVLGEWYADLPPY